VIQISSKTLRNVITSKLVNALGGTVLPDYLETLAEDISAAVIEQATVRHNYVDCSHRSDYASDAEHARDCPAAYQPIMNGYQEVGDDGGAYGESLGGQ